MGIVTILTESHTVLEPTDWCVAAMRPSFEQCPQSLAKGATAEGRQSRLRLCVLRPVKPNRLAVASFSRQLGLSDAYAAGTRGFQGTPEIAR